MDEGTPITYHEFLFHEMWNITWTTETIPTLVFMSFFFVASLSDTNGIATDENCLQFYFAVILIVHNDYVIPLFSWFCSRVELFNSHQHNHLCQIHNSPPTIIRGNPRVRETMFVAHIAVKSAVAGVLTCLHPLIHL